MTQPPSHPHRHSHSPRKTQHVLVRRIWLGVSAFLMLCCGLAGFVGTLSGAFLLYAHSNKSEVKILDTNHPFYADSPIGPDAAASPLSTVFTPEIDYWEPLLKAWAKMYQVDPNLIATLIQIESCGDPSVSSSAGAQGLFQVMPFHFAPEEDMLDVQTNARRGLEYLVGSLEQSDGHAGLALAGYNGGHGVISRGWAGWPSETQRYYYWGARIYAEAVSGMPSSPTLDEWLAAGGMNLCARANQSQQQLELQAQQVNKQASVSVSSP